MRLILITKCYLVDLDKIPGEKLKIAVIYCMPYVPGEELKSAPGEGSRSQSYQFHPPPQWLAQGWTGIGPTRTSRVTFITMRKDVR